MAIACAGAWSDRLAVACGAPAEPRIVPFRGAYLRLRPERRELVRSNIYPVPDPDLPFLGMHLTRRIDGEVLLGPSALLVGARDAYRLGRIRPRDLGQSLGWPGTWRLAAHFWRTGLMEIRAAASRRAFVRELRRFVPELRVGDVAAGPAGIRAQAVARDGSLVDDFVVHRTERAVHVRNAPSPAATSSLALARLIVDEADAVGATPAEEPSQSTGPTWSGPTQWKERKVWLVFSSWRAVPASAETISLTRLPRRRSASAAAVCLGWSPGAVTSSATGSPLASIVISRKLPVESFGQITPASIA